MLNNIHQLIHARIPTDMGEFRLYLYDSSPDNKEHLAVVAGNVTGRENVLVRVHSECFTGDVLGSRRCDCGEQLELALKSIAAEGEGVVIYLRQEGRGIGLRDKLRAYNLQDEGYDTVDANLMLGHADDEREYSAAAAILHELGIKSIRLMTNNPDKIESLQALNVHIKGRIPLQPKQITADNANYLQTKVERMRHLLKLPQPPYTNGQPKQPLPSPLGFLTRPLPNQRPWVTLSYAQTLDGSIAAERGRPLAISDSQALRLTHQLRAVHDGLLVGIDTVLADDPSLTVRLVEGKNPRPVVLDSHLRFPVNAKLLQNKSPVIIVTTAHASLAIQKQLEAAGAQVLRLPADTHGRVSLPALLTQLHREGIQRLMVEGGAHIIHSFLQEQLVDYLVVTISLQFVGGHPAVGQQLSHFPRLQNPQQQRLGQDLVVWGDLNWADK